MTIIQSEKQQNGILILTLNRPDKLNALSIEMLETLELHLQNAKQDETIKALLLTGEGKAFCAGADIHRLAECNPESGYHFARFGQAIFRQFETLGKPSLSAVNGFAFGGGCELAMSTTLRIASNQALFGQPEIKLGVIPGYGGTQRLARLIGKGRALDLCLTGRFIHAETALNWGLVTELTAPEALLGRALEILSSVIEMPSIATKAIIETIEHGYDLNLEDALHIEALQFARTCGTQDKNEGVRAFLEKRQPHFQGQ